MDLCNAGLKQMKQTPTGLCDRQHRPRLHCVRTCQLVRDVPFVLEACGQSVLGTDQLQQEDRRQLASVAGNVQLKGFAGHAETSVPSLCQVTYALDL